MVEYRAGCSAALGAREKVMRRVLRGLAAGLRCNAMHSVASEQPLFSGSGRSRLKEFWADL